MSLRSFTTKIYAGVVLAALSVGCFTNAPAIAKSRATPTPAPTPTPVADPAVTKIARQQFVAWQAGSINKSLYAPTLQAKLTDAKIADISHALGLLGALTDTVYLGPFIANDLPPDAHGYIYQMRCREGSVYLQLILDGQNKIASIFFRDKLTTEEVEVPATPAPSATP